MLPAGGLARMAKIGKLGERLCEELAITRASASITDGWYATSSLALPQLGC
jgi:hypothetical protein